MQIGLVRWYQNHGTGEGQRVTTAIKTTNAGDIYAVHYRGVPASKLAPYRIAVVIALICGGIQHVSTEAPMRAMVCIGIAGVCALYALVGYGIYGIFAGFSGVVAFNPKEQVTKYTNKLFGITVGSGKIPWEDKLNVDLEPLGIDSKSLPLCCYRLKIVTQFMSYHVATFGPKQTDLAKHFAKSLVRARRGLMPKKTA